MVAFHIEGAHWLSYKILDTASAASLFVTLVGALLVRHQFALGLLPRINYISALTTKEDIQKPNTLINVWRVEIRNTGLGSAIINHTEYFLELSDGSNFTSAYVYDSLVKEFGIAGLSRHQDYWLDNITAGYSLLPKDDSLIFEIKTCHLEKLKRFSMMLYFQGQLGDKYCKEISLTPHS